MNKPRICAAITTGDIAAVKKVELLVDLLEVRIDLIGEGWQKLVGELEKPWIACNRTAVEGGKWQGSEAERVESLLEALELGASTVDIELSTENLDYIVSSIKRKAKCLVSYHNLEGTPSQAELDELLEKQVKAGADICKIVTTAREFKDNMTILNIISEHPELKIVSFAMGPLGYVSRILSPLAGGYFTYASITKGKESAPGQITVEELTKIYGILGE